MVNCKDIKYTCINKLELIEKILQLNWILIAIEEFFAELQLKHLWYI